MHLHGNSRQEVQPIYGAALLLRLDFHSQLSSQVISAFCLPYGAGEVTLPRGSNTVVKMGQTKTFSYNSKWAPGRGFWGLLFPLRLLHLSIETFRAELCIPGAMEQTSRSILLGLGLSQPKNHPANFIRKGEPVFQLTFSLARLEQPLECLKASLEHKSKTSGVQ